MFRIDNIRVEILTNKSETPDDLYGFDFPFSQGLNIMAGQNSRGKTTVNSCIYYALAMEELLGASNEKALDKSLKEEFAIKSGEGEELTYKVIRSKVLLEISNDNNEKVRIERYIKPPSGSRTTQISVFKLDDSKSTESVVPQILFANGRGNTEDPNGFYSWFSDFMQLEIPQVSSSSRADGYSPLYLQVIFSALFIEQTKGWSEFFATMPFFGVTKAKEKIVEFLLGLSEIRVSTRRDVLLKERQSIVDQWTKLVKSVSYLERQSNSSIVNLPEVLTEEIEVIDRIGVRFLVSEGESISFSETLAQKQEQIKELEDRPISTVEANREAAIASYNEQREEYNKLREYVDRFESKLNLEKLQVRDLESQLESINSEIKDHLNLQKVFSENIINQNGANHCPTCSQEVSVNLISSKQISIPQLTLEENTGFLKSQKRLIESSLSSLNDTVTEKKTLLLYFKNAIRNKEVLIKALSKDLISDDRAFSESDIVRRLQLEREIESLNILDESVSNIKTELKALGTRYHNNSLNFGLLGESEADDERKLKHFETLYKGMLSSFRYESNELFKISINRKEPFKYFPVYKRYTGDELPQSIRINSSASDFVRNIWAYTIALLIDGENHPGVIILDEPGQHRTNLRSLKGLIEASSKIVTKQVIIFTSVDKQLNEEGETIDLKYLISDLEEGKFNLIELDNVNKVIMKL